MELPISSGRGPLFPMQVMQPYPQTWKPRVSRWGRRPEFLRYSVTTLDPGAREVLTWGQDLSPSSAAFLATSPAAIMTEGLAVLVHDVMDAMTSDPSPSCPATGFLCSSTPSALSDSANLGFISLRGILSWGLLCPARQGSTVERSSSRVSVYSGSPSYHMVCSRMYFSIVSMWASSLPLSLRYSMVFSSTGQNPMVAPYSGPMLAMVDLSARHRFW